MSAQLPADAIDVQEAIRRYGHSWTWYKSHMPVYYRGRIGYVSDAQARAEHEKSQEIRVRYPENRDGE